jgi:aminoglycoside phosphotransferase (APT) family kinase protein
LHGDFHPGNVVLTQRGPVVIDWRNTTEGPPDLSETEIGRLEQAASLIEVLSGGRSPG